MKTIESLESKIHLANLRAKAEDTRPARSPYIGIPITTSEGERKCVIVPRKILQAAVVFAESVRWDEGKQRLILNGDKRSCYSLISQDAYHVRGKLEEWARAQRKRGVSNGATTPAQRKAAKLDQDIAKLRKQAFKLQTRRPVNPICQAPRENVSDYIREAELAWHRGKAVRVQLSHKFTSPALLAMRHIGIRSAGPCWKELYREAARILGIDAISDRDKHSRITKLTSGPSLHDYLLSPEEYLARQRKPWRCETSFDVDALRKARLYYLESLSQCRAIQAQIDNLLKLKAEILQGV
jgi:hypothetical protein